MKMAIVVHYSLRRVVAFRFDPNFLGTVRRDSRDPTL